jgi:hypothetical protein
MAIAVARAARAVDDATVAIYPVDARGLVGTGVATADTMPEVAAMKGKVTSTPQLPPRGVAQSVSNLDGFKQLAASTGGRPFFNRNDINAAIRSAIDDGRVTSTQAPSRSGATARAGACRSRWRSRKARPTATS